jgi:ATP-dependent Lhr-like helicase
MTRLNDLPDKPTCPKCGSTRLSIFSHEEEQIRYLVDKKGEKLTKSEQKLLEQALETAELISTYGKAAAVALAGRRVRTQDALQVLRKQHVLSDRFFELVIEAERDALKRRFA